MPCRVSSGTISTQRSPTFMSSSTALAHLSKASVCSPTLSLHSPSSACSVSCTFTGVPGVRAGKSHLHNCPNIHSSRTTSINSRPIVLRLFFTLTTAITATLEVVQAMKGFCFAFDVVFTKRYLGFPLWKRRRER